MNKILVIGGSGVLGSAVVHELQKHRLNVLVGSRNRQKADTYSPVREVDTFSWMPVDLATGEGLPGALDGVDTVFHLASGQGKIGRESVEVVFTRNLLAALKQSDVKHLIYSSIVGVNKIPYSYYQAKFEAEKLIQASRIPYTILRATQFYEFVDFILGKLLRLPIGFMPKKLLIQPVDVSVVAQTLYRLMQAGNQQNVVDLGGPLVYDAGTLARLWMQARQVSKPFLPVPVFGDVMTKIVDGFATCPEAATGTRTWEDYLTDRYSQR